MSSQSDELIEVVVKKRGRKPKSETKANSKTQFFYMLPKVSRSPNFIMNLKV